MLGSKIARLRQDTALRHLMPYRRPRILHVTIKPSETSSKLTLHENRLTNVYTIQAGFIHRAKHAFSRVVSIVFRCSISRVVKLIKTI